LLRGLNRRLRALWRPSLPLVYSSRYALEIPGAPVDPRRAERILAFLQHEGLLRPRQVQRARRIPISSLRRVHGDDYLERLQNRDGLSALLGFDHPDGSHDEFLDMQRSVVGGTLRAGLLLQNPTLDFARERPRLPGQKHPGLIRSARPVSPSYAGYCVG
jgi:hypothetical protein